MIIALMIIFLQCMPRLCGTYWHEHGLHRTLNVRQVYVSSQTLTIHSIWSSPSEPSSHTSQHPLVQATNIVAWAGSGRLMTRSVLQASPAPSNQWRELYHPLCRHTLIPPILGLNRPSHAPTTPTHAATGFQTDANLSKPCCLSGGNSPLRNSDSQSAHDVIRIPLVLHHHHHITDWEPLPILSYSTSKFSFFTVHFTFHHLWPVGHNLVHTFRFSTTICIIWVLPHHHLLTYWEPLSVLLHWNCYISDQFWCWWSCALIRACQSAMKEVSYFL